MESIFHYVIHGFIPFFPEMKILFLIAFCTNPESSSNLISAIMIPVLKTYGIDILKIQSMLMNKFTILIHPYYINLINSSSIESIEELEKIRQDLNDSKCQGNLGTQLNSFNEIK
eukprot:gene5167-8773_t